ncbi:hypothetical protein REH65_33115 (plasmid) [Saccharopolyspora sp. ID03-671]|uniref:hypothetical protein n=1 Tax=Saccharopolyspora sp. ID03-671 TaxID=3073066 RepID=UPI0030F48F2A
MTNPQPTPLGDTVLGLQATVEAQQDTLDELTAVVARLATELGQLRGAVAQAGISVPDLDR